MSREIKFRVWDEKNKEFLFYGLGHLITGAEVVPDHLIGIGLDHWQQYTGLKDKNGKEIYEGDVVDVGKKGTRAEIVFSNGCFQAKDQKGGGWTIDHTAEVIGNIYKNPELLKSL